MSLHYPAPFSCLKAAGFRARALCSDGVDALLPGAKFKDDILLELMRLGYVEQIKAAGRVASGPEEVLLGVVRAWRDFAL